jgi:uncharacterized metal-binding protein
MEEIELTKKEELAIKRLQKLAKTWPKTLWLFSCSGSLEVHKLNKDNEVAIDNNGSPDPNYCVETIIGIKNDGGDY